MTPVRLRASALQMPLFRDTSRSFQIPPYLLPSFLICLFICSRLHTPSHPLTIRSPTYPSAHPGKYLTAYTYTPCPSSHLLIHHPPASPPIYLSTHALPIHLSTHLPIYLPIYQPTIYSSIHPLAHPNHISILPFKVYFLSIRHMLVPVLGAGKT